MLPFRFYLISDRLGAQKAGVEPLELLPRLAGGGLRALQVRERDLAPEPLYDYCLKVGEVLGGAGGETGFGSGGRVNLFLNHHADLAHRLGWAGAHLREEGTPLSGQPLHLRKALRFGVSTHSLEGVLAAEAAGAWFATFGPVFATPSKAAYGDPVGLAALERAARATRLPLLALGGVTPARTRECLSAGAHGVAAISAIWRAPDPLAALNAFAEELGGL